MGLRECAFLVFLVPKVVFELFHGFVCRCLVVAHLFVEFRMSLEYFGDVDLLVFAYKVFPAKLLSRLWQSTRYIPGLWLGPEELAAG